MDVERACDNLNNLVGWKLDGRVQERVKDTGFDGLLRLTNLPVSHNLPLLSALVESYDERKRCFVFNNHRVVFGLEDVLYITGLPVDGNPVTGIDGNGKQMCKKYLGCNGCGERRTGVTTFEWLQENFELVPETIDKDSPEIEPYVRAYLLYLIGSVVVPDYSGSRVPVMYLSLMEDLECIKDYAWGAALLAHLHFSLESFKQRYSLDRRNILMGHSYSLMIFAMERIPKLVLRFYFDSVNPVDDYLPTTFPLLAGWTKLLCEHSNTDKKITKSDCLQILGELEEDDIVWQPYKRLPHDFLPQYCAGQEKMGMSRTILICFEKAVYHRPDLSPKQFGIQEVNTSMLSPCIALELQTRSGRKGLEGIDWRKARKYRKYNREWDLRASYLITESVYEGTETPLCDALASSSQPSHDLVPLCPKRKRVDLVYHKKLKTKKTSGTLVDAYVSTNSVALGTNVQTESQLDPSASSRSLETIDLYLTSDETDSPSIGALPVISYQEVDAHDHPEPATNHPSSNPLDSGFFPIAESDKLLDELSSLLADFDNLLQGSGTRTAKETIRGIVCRGFDALTNSESQEDFLASSEILLAADVFPSELRTRLTAFRNELPHSATAFLQAQEDIHTALEFSCRQEFLDEQAVKHSSLQERLKVAYVKIANLGESLNAAREKRAKMEEFLAALFDKSTIAKLILEADVNISQVQAQLDAALEKRTYLEKVIADYVGKTLKTKLKYASMNPQAAGIEFKEQAAKVIEQCESSWLDLRTSLLRFV